MADYIELYSLAFRLLRSVYNEGESPRELLEKARFEGKRATADERRFLRFAVYGVLRRDLSLEWEIRGALRKKKINPRLLTLLKLGLFLLRESGKEAAITTDLTVKLCERLELSWAKGIVNSILRKLALERIPPPEFEKDPSEHLAASFGLPQWLGERIIITRGAEAAKSFAEYLLEIPPLSIRVNLLRCDVEKLKKLLQNEGVEPSPGTFFPEQSLLLPPDANFGGFKSFKRGLWSVQNEASQAVSMLLAPREGEAILDICAAPGTKTAHMFEISRGKAIITATDINHDRLLMLEEDLKRLGISKGIDILPYDGLTLKPLNSFDAVLLDAPCTGIGTWSRHPDGRIFRGEADIIKLAATQRALLDKAARFVKLGGRLVYSVCTITNEETTEQTKRFLERHKDFKLVLPENTRPAIASRLNKRGEFITWPPEDRVDGFYAAVLARRKD